MIRTPLLTLAASLVLCGGAQADPPGVPCNFVSMLVGTPPFDVDHPMLHAWFEASEGVNITPPADGDAVINWLDQSGHERHLVRTDLDPDRHATWRADAIEGAPAVAFDGNDYIWCDPDGPWGTMDGDKTIFVAMRCNVADGGYVFDAYAGSARNAFFAGQNDNPQQWCLYDGSTVLGSSQVAAGAIRVHTLEFSDAGMTHRIGGVMTAQGPSTNGPMTGIVVGSRYNLTFGLDGEVGTLLVFNGILPDLERSEIENWLNDRYPATESPEQPTFVDVFVNGEGGWPQYRIPSLLTTRQGSLLAFTEGRANIGDNAQNDILMRRSTDGGLTWGEHVLLDDAGGNCANNPTLVQVQSGILAGRIIMMYLTIPDGCHLGCVDPGYEGDNIIRIMKMHSDDDGLTWSSPVDVTPGCKRVTTADVMIGPGLGIELRRSPYEERLVMPLAERVGGHWYAY
ncbi:MAG: sialidase family protein, partial [Planctomycetota bacterium]|nr:sialidase family protein [Planctomycetota bacterium]